MGCGCGGGSRSYARPATPQSGSQHVPSTRIATSPRPNHSPQMQAPKLVQASALAARRQGVVRRQV